MTNFQLRASATDQQNAELYTDPKDMIRYPFNYANSFVDTYSGDQTIANVAHTFSGTRTVTYDGWGTVMVPWGTVSGVLRLPLIRREAVDER